MPRYLPTTTRLGLLANLFVLVANVFGDSAVLAVEIPGLVIEVPWKQFAPGSYVAATTVDGRIVRGQIDPRTTGQRLWIVAEAEGIVVGSVLAAGDINHLETGVPVALPPRGHVDLPETTGRFRPRHAAADRPRPPRNDVESLSVYAELENWDADAEPDGLRLYIQPRGNRGELVPTSGMLSVRCIIERDKFGRAPPIEEQWSAAVSAAQFGPNGAVVDLPFRRRDFADWSMLHASMLHVRLNVAGQGAFDATLYGGHPSPALLRAKR